MNITGKLHQVCIILNRNALETALRHLSDIEAFLGQFDCFVRRAVVGEVVLIQGDHVQV
ncbi:MAG: hypothetical protein JRE07_05445 [Deltaproteobacteria bacterium]|nr:hypothetical protein [Deltaproteobacteria bacterium]